MRFAREACWCPQDLLRERAGLPFSCFSARHTAIKGDCFFRLWLLRILRDVTAVVGITSETADSAHRSLLGTSQPAKASDRRPYHEVNLLEVLVQPPTRRVGWELDLHLIWPPKSSRTSSAPWTTVNSKWMAAHLTTWQLTVTLQFFCGPSPMFSYCLATLEGRTCGDASVSSEIGYRPHEHHNISLLQAHSRSAPRVLEWA